MVARCPLLPEAEISPHFAEPSVSGQCRSSSSTLSDDRAHMADEDLFDVAPRWKREVAMLI